MATTFTRDYQGVQVPEAGTYALDRGHTTVEFVGRHLMITKVRGRFTDFDGQVAIGDTPEQSSVEVTIDTASVDTSDEKRDGVSTIVSDADERVVNFLELLVERHRMPALFRIKREFDSLWAEENKLLPVTVTSAIDLDEGLVNDIGKRIEEQTDRRVELSSNVDPEVLGGLKVQVGNMVLDGTVRNRLERLRKQVARAT